jgi:hypothetical protein
MKSAFVLTHNVPGKQLHAQLHAQVQGLWILCTAKEHELIVPQVHAAVVSRESSGANALMSAQTGLLEYADGTLSGADESFSYAYECSPGMDVCAAGADVNESCSGKYGTGTDGIQTGADRI